jgi:hypothetical protein
MAKVGIKLADGKFYPILDEYDSSRKNLVLTTVSNGQTSAQIDFYRDGKTAAGQMQYAGTLVVDSLSPKYAGETSIELRIRSSGDGHIFAEAYEADGTGGAQKLEIDIAGLDTNMPDTYGLGIDDELTSGVKVAAKRRLNPIVPVIIAAVIFLAAAIVFLFLFLSRGFPQPENVYAEPQAREETVVSPPPVRDEAANRADEPPPPAPQNDGGPRNLPESRNVVPDTSRKALRTEFVQ